MIFVGVGEPNKMVVKKIAVPTTPCLSHQVKRNLQLAYSQILVKHFDEKSTNRINRHYGICSLRFVWVERERERKGYTCHFLNHSKPKATEVGKRIIYFQLPTKATILSWRSQIYNNFSWREHQENRSPPQSPNQNQIQNQIDCKDLYVEEFRQSWKCRRFLLIILHWRSDQNAVPAKHRMLKKITESVKISSEIAL